MISEIMQRHYELFARGKLKFDLVDINKNTSKLRLNLFSN